MKTHELESLFGGRRTEELTSVVLSPYGVSKGGTGTINMPAGVSLHDFESFSVAMGVNVNTISYDAMDIPKSAAINEPEFRLVYINSNRAQQYELIIFFDYQNNRITWSGKGNGTAANVYPLYLTADKKKYATTNLSVEIPVNGGNNIATGSRYEIQASALPASFLNTDGTIKKNVNVSAWLYHSNEWFEAGVAVFNSAKSTRSGTVAKKTDTKIVVRTGNDPASGLNDGALLLPNEINFNSAPCKVVATLAGEAYTVRTA